MNIPLIGDLVLAGLLLVTCWLFYIFRNNRADDNEPLTLDDLVPINRIYPATLIRQAGLSVLRSRLLYWSIKVLLSLVAVILLLEFLPTTATLLALMFIAILAFLGLDIWLLLKRYSRKQQIDSSLEFFISLLIVYLQSGANLSQAFRLSAQYGLVKGHPLADELLLLSLELDSGRERQRAFSDLAERTGVRNLTKLAGIISMGLQIGSPLLHCLQTQLTTIQQQRQELLNNKISRKSLETLFPMLLVCFPMFLVLVFFPAAIQFFDLLTVLADVL
jgi:tight adherence protein C